MLYTIVPNGGHVASLLLAAAVAHSAARGHPDVISARWDYLHRTKSGPATLVMDTVKLGRGLSVHRITLYQDGALPVAPWVSPAARRLGEAYVTCGRHGAETGSTLYTKWLRTDPPHASRDVTPASASRRIAGSASCSFTKWNCMF